MWCIIRGIKSNNLSTQEIESWVHTFSADELAVQGWTHLTLVDNCQRHENAIWRTETQNAVALISFHFPSTEVVEILFLGTAPFCRGQGLMGHLLDEFLLAQKNKVVWLECREDNLKARHLYAKKGFREVGRRPGYYSDGSAAILFNY